MAEVIGFSSGTKSQDGDEDDSPAKYAKLARAFADEVEKDGAICMLLAYLQPDVSYHIFMKNNPDRGNFQMLGFVSQLEHDAKEFFMNDSNIKDTDNDAS